MVLSPQMQAYLLWLQERGLDGPMALQVEYRNGEPAKAVPSPGGSPVENTDLKSNCRGVGGSETAPHAEIGLFRQPLKEIQAAAASCESCDLNRNRTTPPWGFGSDHARLLFVSDVPSPEHAASGWVFSTAERHLFEKMIQAMGLDITQVFVTTSLLCPAPLTCLPKPSSFSSCRTWLKKIVETIEPEAIVTLGRISAMAVLGSQESFLELRGQWRESPHVSGVEILATFHPRDLLRFPGNKRLAWTDLQMVMVRLGLE